MRIRGILPVLAIAIFCAVAPAFAQAQQPATPKPPPQAAPTQPPAPQPATMTDAERQAHIAKAWNENRVFGPDNGAFFRP